MLIICIIEIYIGIINIDGRRNALNGEIARKSERGEL